MRLRFDLMLGRSPEEVWRAFDNLENLTRWQPTLESFEAVSGTPGQPGAVSRLTYREGGKLVVLTETITLRREPEEFAGTYSSGMGTNTVHHRFERAGSAGTSWIVTCEFGFRGLWRLLAPLFRGAITRRTRADLERFKTMLETGRLAT